MKASFFSFVAAVALLATTAASAAPLHDHDLRRMSPHERARYEQVQRAHERQLARERTRWETQHCSTRSHR
jgi:hypothetical protein